MRAACRETSRRGYHSWGRREPEERREKEEAEGIARERAVAMAAPSGSQARIRIPPDRQRLTRAAAAVHASAFLPEAEAPVAQEALHAPPQVPPPAIKRTPGLDTAIGRSAGRAVVLLRRWSR